MTARARAPGKSAISPFLALASGIFTASFILASAPSRLSPWASALTIAVVALIAMGLWAIAKTLLIRQGSATNVQVNLRVSVAWFLGSLVLAAYAPVYWLAGDHPALAPWTRWYVMVIGALLAARALVAQFPSSRGEPITNRRPGATLTILISVYIISCIVVNAYRWKTLTLGNVDSAIIIQGLRNTIAGEPLFFNTIEKASHLGVHSSPIYLLLLPLYALVRSPALFLIVLPPAVIGLSGIPFYRLARGKVGVTPALALTAAYLLSPYVAARSMGDLYEMTLLPLVLLPALYFYDRHKLVPYLCCAVLCLSVKESIALTMPVFGLLSLIRRRRWPWVAIPVLLSVASLYFSYGILMPAFGGDAVASRTVALLGDLGKTPLEVLRFAFTAPVDFGRRVFTLSKLGLVYQLFQPLLFVFPWLSPEILLAFPSLGINLLAQGGSVGVRAWESAIFGPLLFASAATGIRDLSRRLAAEGIVEEAGQKLERLLAISIFFGTLACVPYWLRVQDLVPRAYISAQRTAVAMVPSDASVSAPDYMMAHFADRDYLQLQTGAPFWADYHIVDMHWIDSLRGHRVSEQAAQVYEQLVSHAVTQGVFGELRLLWAGDGIYVFRREDR